MREQITINSKQLTVNSKKLAINSKNQNLLSVICYLFCKSKGFTLIEVLVAATIIGLLSTIGITGFQAITKSGRDALRKSDLEQIRSALEIYKSENSLYPSENTCVVGDAGFSNYISPYPSDPKSPTYRYCYARDPTSNLRYFLCAHLENGSNTTDYDCDSAGGSNDCTGNCNYKVTNP